MNTRTLTKLIFFSAFNVVALILLALEESAELNIYFSIMAVLQGILGLWVLKDFYPVYSLAPLFLILTEIFHFGEAFVLAIGRDDLISHSNIDLAGSMQKYNEANIFAFMVQAFVVIGAVLASNSSISMRYRPRYTSLGKQINAIYLRAQPYTYTVGWISAVIGAIPTILYNMLMIKLTLSGVSYSGIRSQVDLGPLMLLTILYYPGMILLILGSVQRGRKKRAFFLFLFACAFEVLCMLSGNRGKQLCMLLIYVFIYYRFIGRFNWRKILPFAAAAYIGVAFLYFISSYRLYGMGDALSSGEFFSVILGRGPLLSLLAEQGSTLNMVALTVRDVPSYTPYSWGMQYIISLFSVFPDTGGWKGNLPYLSNTLHYLNTNLPLGDSYIAELYHNFGWFSGPFAILIGAFLGRITVTIERLIKRKNYLALGGYLVLFSKLLWMVRCNFFNFLYDFTWSCTAIIVLSLLVLTYRGRRYIGVCMRNEGDFTENESKA